MKMILTALSIAVLAGMMMIIPDSSAHPHQEITINQINDQIALETIVTTMTIPENTDLKWATMKGTVSDPVDWYPVTVQFYKENQPIHFAQVDLLGDNSYNYKFQIRNLDDGSMLNIFEGEYTVKISAVVYHNPHSD